LFRNGMVQLVTYPIEQESRYKQENKQSFQGF